MEVDRREFVVAIGSAALLAVTHNVRATAPTAPATASLPSGEEHVVDAGQLNEFSKDGVYAGHREQGFFVIRREEHVFALSSVCTHRGCKVVAQEDQSYVCKCHGSAYDRDGKVTKGPASKDLPRLAVALDTNLHLQVDLNQKFEVGHFHQPDTMKTN